jgi:hypothetical protein
MKPFLSSVAALSLAFAAMGAAAQVPPASGPFVILGPAAPLKMPGGESGDPAARFVMPGPLPGGPAGVKFRVSEDGVTGYPIPWRDLDLLFGIDGWILKWAEDRIGVVAVFGDGFDPACRAVLEKSLADGVAELNGLADAEFRIVSDPKDARIVFNFAEGPLPSAAAARLKEIAAPATRTARVAASRFGVLTASLNDRTGAIEAAAVDVQGFGPAASRARTPEAQSRYCTYFDAARELIVASVPDLHRTYRLPYNVPVDRYGAFDRAIFQLLYWRGVKRNDVSSDLPEKLIGLRPKAPAR